MMKISKSDRRVIIVTAVIAAVILMYQYILGPWFDAWEKVEMETQRQIARLEKIDMRSAVAKAKFIAMQKIVPVCVIPLKEDKQRILFQEKLHAQMKSVGIKQPTRSVFGGKGKTIPGSAYKLVKLQVKCVCKITQAMDLLAVLPENPYLVAVEEFQLSVNQSSRANVNLTFTVSTYVL